LSHPTNFFITAKISLHKLTYWQAKSRVRREFRLFSGKAFFRCYTSIAAARGRRFFAEKGGFWAAISGETKRAAFAGDDGCSSYSRSIPLATAASWKKPFPAPPSMTYGSVESSQLRLVRPLDRAPLYY
jgi:hypothetical protein